MSKFIDFINKRKKDMKSSLVFQVQGESMHPIICNGEKIIVELTYDDLEEGDIILYKMFDNHLTVHRIIKKEIEENGQLNYITKGDNNSEIDSYVVTSECIIGVIRK